MALAEADAAPPIGAMGVWSGSCHCGAVRFRVEAEIEELTRCDCSLCRRRGALMAKVHETGLTIVAGGENLTLYRWNTRVARHWFCRTCGIYPFHRKRAAPGFYGVNVGCLESFDVAAYPHRPADGLTMSVRPAGARAEWDRTPRGRVMPVKLPKYAHWVAERRFLVEAANMPPVDPASARRIEDLYIEGGRLRLRAITLPNGEREFKLGKKYAPDNPLIGPMTNLYLSADEHAVLSVLPGHAIEKRRYKVGAFVVDVFEGALKGLVTAECEATNRMAAMAVDIPAWCVREVTSETEYTGWSLAQAQAVPAR